VSGAAEPAAVPVLETPRLWLRQLATADAPFILRLVNEPSWLANIGDRGVRTLADACRYIETGPVEMYGRLGFGLYCVGLRDAEAPIGICGLLKRDTLEDVDLGFAFLPEHWGRGYAREAAAAVVAHGWAALGLVRIVAIISPHNDASRRVLEAIGFVEERPLRLGTANDEVRLFGARAPR